MTFRSDVRGFTMVAVMITMLITGLLGVAAFASVNGDLPFSRDSKDRKQAYAAAEAGLNYYLFQLNRDVDFWKNCATVAPPNGIESSPINLSWNGSGIDPRTFRKVQGGKADYAIELIPAPSYTKCVVNDGESVIDPQNATFKVRTTGRSGDAKRSLGVTLRRKSFLDYLYFTNFETQDPKVYGNSSDSQYAADNCVQYRAGRQALPDPSKCTEISFGDTDVINGPFHTNDDIQTCGTPIFGRNVNDRIEISGPAPGWKATPAPASCPGGVPEFKGTLATGSKILEMPDTNAELKTHAEPGYLYTGKTTIRLNGATMTVTNAGVAGSPKTMPLPTNGVIYVQQGASCSPVPIPPIDADYVEGSGCAILRLQGNYDRSLTLGSQSDIIVDGNITSNGDAIAGLVADNFVRVYHPVVRSSGNCDNAASTPKNITIESAILSLNHSFIVDNYDCGTTLGTLTIKGAIAQQFRGPVGLLSGRGYIKQYEYDDRFRYRSPPYFVEPVAAAWRVLRTNEQVPAR